MSIKAMSLVGERSRAKGSNLAMLRSIADYAKDDGCHAWPSAATLAFDQRFSQRAAELIVRKLVQDGELWPEWSEADGRLYLHVRCVFDWAIYQTEGPIPERAKISRKTKRSFAQKLCRIATESARDRARYAKNPANLGGASITDPSDPSIEPSREPLGPLGSADADGASPETAFAELWNDTTTAPILPCLKLTALRRRHIRKRLEERPLTEWVDVFARIQASHFCRGANDRGWVADLAWVIGSADVAVKVLEGKYDTRPGRERPFTATELADAKQVLRSIGGCWHDPHCANWNACTAAIIRKWRSDRGEAA